MSRLSRSTRLLDKAEAALLAAIEAYNKPDSPYREETFAILMLNAWELLLKAKLLAESKNDIRALYIYETRETRAGRPGKKLYLKTNRAGNPFTKSIGTVLNALNAIGGVNVPPEVRDNIEGLVVIRDNAIHYYNATPELAKKVLEFGTASTKNFIALVREWFDRDLSRFSLYLLPVGFLSTSSSAAAVAVGHDEKRIVDHLAGLMKTSSSSPDPDYHVAVAVELQFTKAKPGKSLAAISVTKDPNAPKVIISDEQLLEQFPWDYETLCKTLGARYTDFKRTKAFHDIRRPLNADPRYTQKRYLNPRNPSSSSTAFYSSNILNEFDKHYTRKAKKKAGKKKPGKKKPT